MKRQWIRLASGLGLAMIMLGQAGRISATLDQLNALLLPLVVLLLLLLLLSLLKRDVVAAAMAGIGLIVGSLQLGGASGDPSRQSGQRDIRILTLSAWHDNADPGALADLITKKAPDIALLQESDGNAASVIDRLLPGHFRLKSCSAAHCSLTILSRWPLRRIEDKAGKGEALPDLLLAQVEAPSGTFRVINVHLPRPSYAKAPVFLDRLVAMVHAAKGQPLIVAGDFNMATGSFGLARFTQRSGLRRIEGFRPTYPAHLPIPAFIGIDHVFIGEQWGKTACRRIGPGGSDHHGIACRLSL